MTGSEDLVQRIHSILNALDAGKMDRKEAELRERLLRTESKVLQMEIEHARITNRLQNGSDGLPAFKRSN